MSSGRPTAGRLSPVAAGLTTLTPVSEVTADALDAEDQKIITLARSTRARVAASEGAAVRDETGRTYTAAAVALPSLRLSALRLAVAMAVSSGAERLEAAIAEARYCLETLRFEAVNPTFLLTVHKPEASPAGNRAKASEF